jgi:hypothetical protein
LISQGRGPFKLEGLRGRKHFPFHLVNQLFRHIDSFVLAADGCLGLSMR